MDHKSIKYLREDILRCFCTLSSGGQFDYITFYICLEFLLKNYKIKGIFYD